MITIVDKLVFNDFIRSSWPRINGLAEIAIEAVIIKTQPPSFLWLQSVKRSAKNDGIGHLHPNACMRQQNGKQLKFSAFSAGFLNHKITGMNCIQWAWRPIWKTGIFIIKKKKEDREPWIDYKTEWSDLKTFPLTILCRGRDQSSLSDRVDHSLSSRLTTTSSRGKHAYQVGMSSGFWIGGKTHHRLDNPLLEHPSLNQKIHSTKDNIGQMSSLYALLFTFKVTSSIWLTINQYQSSYCLKKFKSEQK